MLVSPLMDYHIQDYYRHSSDEVPIGHFFKVICLHEENKWSFSDLDSKTHPLPRGWFELARLTKSDRIEFTKEFWLSKLPFTPHLEPFIEKFFNGIDDIGVYLVQEKQKSPFEAHMVYSLSGNRGFFRGLCPIKDQELIDLNRDFHGVIFPRDYLAFLQIHNGFCKTTDTGIVKSSDLARVNEEFQALINSKEGLLTSGGEIVDPKALIAFYDSFGMPFYQCFYLDWYPEEEIGNVYYSGMTNTLSCPSSKEASPDNMAFATFTDWLMFYLETLDA